MRIKPFIMGTAILSTAFLFSCSSVKSAPDDESDSDVLSGQELNSKDSLFSSKTGMEIYECKGAYAGKKVEIYYHIPEGNVREMPVQIVMHGVDRNGDKYRDDWKSLADKYGFIVLAPQFSENQFSDKAYQQGNVTNESGVFVSQDSMTYPIIREIFHFFLDHSVSQATKYNIYGHSAGGQFVHRYLLFNSTFEVDRAIAANTGWYTFPNEKIDYPYGIGNSVDEIGVDVKVYYAKRLTILLGDADTLRTENLRTTAKADAQGLTRLERGNTFFEFCKEDADSRGATFNWERVYVSGVGHSDSKMAPEAARLLYGK
jgi:dienelactone hydrolase